jgi:hypothetical protein
MVSLKDEILPCKFSKNSKLFFLQNLIKVPVITIDVVGEVVRHEGTLTIEVSAQAVKSLAHKVPASH